jgi:hypothetical protein
MVVKHERSVEGIKASLRRLELFFSEAEAQDADKTTLLNMESELIRMESQLQMFSSYRFRGSECSAS